MFFVSSLFSANKLYWNFPWEWRHLAAGLERWEFWNILKLSLENWPFILLYCNLIGYLSNHLIGKKLDQKFHFGFLIWNSDLESDWFFVKQKLPLWSAAWVYIPASSFSITGFHLLQGKGVTTSGKDPLLILQN